MTCPNCNYQNGWDDYDDGYKEIKGNKGDFYETSNHITAIRKTFRSWEPDEEKPIYFCPNCGISFIDVKD